MGLKLRPVHLLIYVLAFIVYSSNVEQNTPVILIVLVKIDFGGILNNRLYRLTLAQKLDVPEINTT